MDPVYMSGSTPAARQPRQRPGEACEGCRRRKLGCDRQQPQCGMCRESGLFCEVKTQHNPRGPKKGFLKALKARVAMLESRLVEQSVDNNLLSPPLTDLTDLPSDGNVPILLDFDQLPLSTSRGSMLELGDYLPTPMSCVSSPTASTAAAADKQINDSTKAELDQLYFDRVHPLIPLLHQRQYHSWARHSVKKTSQTCLQFAMWSLASLLSAQYQHLQENSYLSAKSTLEHLNASNNEVESADVEQAQAWILVATYEFMRTFHRQAWISAGRAFRLVQLIRLHEIDSPAASVSPGTEFVETEEKRRVFWMAYLLDHLFSIRSDGPITLGEQMICTRLPAPEAEFQNGQPFLGNFLSDALIEHDPGTQSPFNECISLVTICGRRFFHGQQCNVRRVYGDAAPGWLVQHRWLDSILARRLHILSQCYPSPFEMHDALLVFANIMAQATVIYLHKGIKALFDSTDEERALEAEYNIRALDAAEKIVKLAKVLTEFHFSKVYPLTPIPLLLCAEYLYNNQSLHESCNLRLQELLNTLQQLKNVNNPNQSYLDLLELSCTPASFDQTRRQSDR